MTETVLEFNNLVKGFASTPVLKGISAHVEAGEVIGLLGLNGAGKTTLLETALGFSLPQQGTAALFGNDSQAMSTATKMRIGFVPQRDELLEGMKGQAYLALIAAFYPKWNHTLVTRLAAEWDVPMDKKIATLSVGQRQKLSIISALGHEPDLLVLDEPVASLDPVARRQFLKELVDIASSHARTIVFSTHIVSDLERVASRVWLLKAGAIAVDISLDDLKEHYVRVHLPPHAALPADFSCDGLVHSRIEQGSTVLMFNKWSNTTLQQLESTCQTTLHPEALSLEEIFLELHV
jgi:ABC-2 type transport system ATP-binding protein